MKKSLLKALIASTFFTVFSIPLVAATIDYTLTSGSDTINFALPQTPTPLACALATSCFSVSPVDLTIDRHTVTNGTSVSICHPMAAG